MIPQLSVYIDNFFVPQDDGGGAGAAMLSDEEEDPFFTGFEDEHIEDGGPGAAVPPLPATFAPATGHVVVDDGLLPPCTPGLTAIKTELLAAVCAPPAPPPPPPAAGSGNGAKGDGGGGPIRAGRSDKGRRAKPAASGAGGDGGAAARPWPGGTEALEQQFDEEELRLDRAGWKQMLTSRHIILTKTESNHMAGIRRKKLSCVYAERGRQARIEATKKKATELGGLAAEKARLEAENAEMRRELTALRASVAVRR